MNCGEIFSTGDKPLTYDMRGMAPLALTWNGSAWVYWCSAICAGHGTHVQANSGAVLMLLPAGIHRVAVWMGR